MSKDNNTEKKDEPMFGNEHLPKIRIEVSQTCLDFRNQPKELILAEEGLHYAFAFFHLLMMVTDKELHRDTEVAHALNTLGYLGQRFAAIAQDNLQDFSLKHDCEVKK